MDFVGGGKDKMYDLRAQRLEPSPTPAEASLMACSSALSRTTCHLNCRSSVPWRGNQSSYTPPNSLLWEPTQLNLDRLRHIQLCSPNSGNRTQNSSHALSLRPRFRPGLHGRGKCAVGRALVGTAGALPALHQDISAPGKGL